jgi:hypothetical protein
MTYYKYAERKAQDEINWGEIGKNVSDTLLEEKKLREDKRAEIDQKTYEFSQALADAPVSQNNDVNEFAARFAGNAQEAMLLLNRNLKSGKMNLRDYTIARQNLMTSTTKMFSTFKNWDAIYKNGIQRLSDGKASNVEGALRALVEGFGKLSSHDAQIDPTSYNISMMKKDENGNYITSPDGFASVKLLEAAAMQQVDRIDFMSILKDRAEKLGQNIMSIVEQTQGMYSGKSTEETYANVRKSEAFGGYVNSVIAEITGTPMNKARILMDYTTPEGGKPWTATRDKTKAGGNVVYFKEGDGGLIPELTKEQEKIVETQIRTNIDAMLDSSYKKQETSSSVPAFKPETEKPAKPWDGKLTVSQRNAAIVAAKRMSGGTLMNIYPDAYDANSGQPRPDVIDKLSDRELVRILAAYENTYVRSGKGGTSLVNDTYKTSFIDDLISSQSGGQQAQSNILDKYNKK